MSTSNFPIWILAKNALIEFGGEEKWVPMKQIVDRVVIRNPERKINKNTVDHQIRRFCVNSHPTHDEFADGGKSWKKNTIFITDKRGNYRIFNKNRDTEIFEASLEEDINQSIEIRRKIEIPKKQLEESISNQLNETIFTILEIIGQKLGFKVEKEWPVPMGKIDLIWYLDLQSINNGSNKVIIGGFEIESSWRTRKHIKGDIMNLMSLNAPISAIIQQTGKEDNPDKVKSLIKNSRDFVKTIDKQIFIWTEDDISKIMSIVGLDNAAN